MLASAMVRACARAFLPYLPPWRASPCLRGHGSIASAARTVAQNFILRHARRPSRAGGSPASTCEPGWTPSCALTGAECHAAQSDGVLKIMLASDIHLGIHERDPIRRDDAKVTFEEIVRVRPE